MSAVTVENLAKIIGSEGQTLLSQMKEAGLSHTDVKDEVTDKDKKTLLEFLKKQQNKSSKTISLNKSASRTEPASSGTVSITRKTITREIVDKQTSEAKRTSTINFDEIEKKRQAGEANKKAEEELRKKEIEQKTLVTRRKAKTGHTPSTKSDSKKVVQVEKRTLKQTRPEISKKEQRELDGENFLSNVEKQEFEKPADLVSKNIQIPETITVSELAQSLSVKGAEVVKKLMSMGVMATLNQPLDQDTAILVTEELGHKGEPAVKVEVEDQLMELVTYDGEEEPRNPVVSVLGHVDHGKTTLLDFIRKANVAAGEDGGITQKIGAYQANTDQGTIAFIDTPGHAAFSEVRARGANSTDIVILVVAADDGLQPQTEEAISHAKAAGVPIVVAVNKMDREEADIEKVKTELSNKELIPEDWGGQTQFLPISALKGDGIKELLEAVTLEAEVLELKAHHKGPAFGVVLDSTTEVGKGAVATILVQKGTLKKGDMILVGEQTKRVRSLVDENGSTLKEAGPSVPASITGLDVPPKAGEEFVVVSSEKMAKEISNERAEKAREERLARNQISNLEMLFESELGNHTILNIVLKADTHGSLEAIKVALSKLGDEKTKIRILSGAVGPINESDNKPLKIILREVLIEMNIPKMGSAYEDPEIDDMYNSYKSIRSRYFVRERRG